MKYLIEAKSIRVNIAGNDQCFDFMFYFDSESEMLYSIKGIEWIKSKGDYKVFDHFSSFDGKRPIGCQLGYQKAAILLCHLEHYTPYLQPTFSYKYFENIIGYKSNLNITVSKRISEIDDKFKEIAFKNFPKDVKYSWLGILKNRDTKNKSSTKFVHSAIRLPDDFDLNNRFHAQRNLELESSISNPQLFNILKREYPIVFESIYSVNGTHLPFLLKEGSIHMPLVIESTVAAGDDNPPRDSLKEQRQSLGAFLYNGDNLQVKKITQQYDKNELTIVKTRYFDILDSADYLPSRIKLYSAELREENVSKETSANLSNLKDCWRSRCDYIIRKNDFSSFNCGLAFSIPIFQIMENNTIRVLSAKGSEFKATGNGLRHVAPAGMFEYWSHEDFKDNTFCLEDFIVLACKELLEETVFSNSQLVVDENYEFHEYLKYFINDKIGKQGVSYSSLREGIDQIRKNWREIWEYLSDKYPGIPVPNPGALDSLLGVDNDYFQKNARLVVDALTLRPEIIMPLYISEELSSIVNWEYDDNSVEMITFRDLDDLNKWVMENYTDYCPPGLAAIYLGAKNYFEHINQ